MRVAGVDAVAGIADRAAADRDVAGEDQRLEARARQLRDAGGEHAVEPLAGLLGGRPPMSRCAPASRSMSNPLRTTNSPSIPSRRAYGRRVRWLMVISGVTTLLAIAAVIGVIGYRVFKAREARRRPR